MSSLVLTDVGAGYPPGYAPTLSEGDYWQDGSWDAAPVNGQYTATSNLSDGNELDTTTGIAGTADIVTLIRVDAVAGAPAQVSLTVDYNGTLTVNYYGWNGTAWVEITDNSGTSWGSHVGSSSESKIATFADGSTTYAIYRIKVDAGSGIVQVTDMRWFTAFVPSLTASLHTNLSAARNLYSDTGATTPVYTEGGSVKAWTDLTAAKNFSDATGALLKRKVTTLGNKPAVQFSDDPTNPASSYYLSRASHFSSALNTAWTCYIVFSRPLAQTNAGYLLQDTTTVSRLGYNHTGTVLTPATFAGNLSIGHGNASTGVVSQATTATEYSNGFNDIGNATTGSGLTNGFGNDTCRIGNDSTPTLADGWNGYVACILMYSASHTEDQQRTIRGELMAFYGITTITSLSFLGNSILAGFTTYNDPLPNQLIDDILNDGTYALSINSSVAGHTTLQRAAAWTGNGEKYGNIKVMPSGGGNYTTGGTPTRTSVDITTAPWGTETDKAAVLYSGALDGLGADIASNDTDTITLTSPGFSAAPAAGVSLRTYVQGRSRASTILTVWEITNDMVNNGSTDGPTANASVKADTPIYQRYKCLCIALKAMGFKVIAVTVLERTTGGPYYGDFETDRGILNGWILADAVSEGWADAVWSAHLVTGFSTPIDTAKYDGVHPTNAGALALATDLAPVIQAIS